MITMQYINLNWGKIAYLPLAIGKNFIGIRGHLILGLQNLSATCGLKYFWVYRWAGIYVVMKIFFMGRASVNLIRRL